MKLMTRLSLLPAKRAILHDQLTGFSTVLKQIEHRQSLQGFEEALVSTVVKGFGDVEKSKTKLSMINYSLEQKNKPRLIAD